MTVLAQRDCNITMAQQLLNDLNVDTHSQQYRCCTMPQTVEAHMRYTGFPSIRDIIYRM